MKAWESGGIEDVRRLEARAGGPEHRETLPGRTSERRRLSHRQ